MTKKMMHSCLVWVQLSNFEKVKEFHRAFGHLIGDEPGWIPGDKEAMHLKLIAEEAKEVNDAVEDFDFVNLAQELADLLYVTYSFAIALGIDIDEVFSAVHNSNMSKLGEDGKPIYREDGKVLKGPNYTPPDIEAVLYK